MNNGIFLKEMGNKIKVARTSNKYTLKKLSELTGIHLTSLWFIENGRKNIHILNLKIIAEAFKMDIKDFL